LIEKTGAIDVYFEEEIQVLVADPDLFDQAAMEETLAELEVEYTDIEGGETR
jgi:hypothetical protein